MVQRLRPLAQCPCGGGGGAAGANGTLSLLIVAGGWLLLRWMWSRWTLQKVGVMNRIGRITVIVTLIIVVGAVIALKTSSPPATDSAAHPSALASAAIPSHSDLPRLLDLGSTSCVPCRMMIPILEELKKEYAGKMQVEFIDVWKDTAAGQRYGVEAIPTQIFFDASGKELYRHQGFIPKQDILAKCKQLGFSLDADTAAGLVAVQTTSAPVTSGAK